MGEPELLAHLPLVLADEPELLTHLAFVLADEPELLAICGGAEPQLFPDVTELFALGDFTAVQPDVAELLAVGDITAVQPFFAGVLARAGRRGEGGLTPEKKTQFKTKKTAEARREEREDA